MIASFQKFYRIVYPNLNSATRPIQHGPDIPILLPLSIAQLSSISWEPITQRPKSLEIFEPALNQPKIFIHTRKIQ